MIIPKRQAVGFDGDRGEKPRRGAQLYAGSESINLAKTMGRTERKRTLVVCADMGGES